MLHTFRTYLGALLLAAGVLITLTSPRLGAVEVEGIGSSDPSFTNAREIALTDALRDAVRSGAGVDVASSTEVSNFKLDYDRVLTSAFGYVKTYRVVSSGLTTDGTLYEVKVIADVAKDRPAQSEMMAMKMIRDLRGSPRIRIECIENIANLPLTAPLSMSVMKQLCTDAGLSVVDERSTQQTLDQQSERDKLVSNDGGRTAQERKVVSRYDYIFRVKVDGEYRAKYEDGEVSSHILTFSADLTVVDPETHETLVMVRIDPTTATNMRITDPQLAAKDCLTRVLNGTVQDRNAKGKAAMTMIARTYSRWITELDLGHTIRLEIQGADRPTWTAFATHLRTQQGVAAVQPREFDSRLISTMDIETRLDSDSISQLATAFFQNSHQVDRVRPSLVTLIPKPAATIVNTAPAAAPSVDDAIQVNADGRSTAGAVDTASAVAADEMVGSTSATKPPPNFLAQKTLGGLNMKQLLAIILTICIVTFWLTARQINKRQDTEASSSRSE